MEKKVKFYSINKANKSENKNHQNKKQKIKKVNLGEKKNIEYLFNYISLTRFETIENFILFLHDALLDTTDKTKLDIYKLTDKIFEINTKEILLMQQDLSLPL